MLILWQILVIYKLIDFRNFLVKNRYTHDGLAKVTVCCFFLKFFIKIIDSINFIVYFFGLIGIFIDLVFLQFFRIILIFELNHLYHFLSCELIILFVL